MNKQLYKVIYEFNNGLTFWGKLIFFSEIYII